MKRIGLLTAVFVCLWLIPGLAPAPTAHAGFMDRVRDIIHLPDEVDKVKKDYKKTKKQLEETKKEMTETTEKAQETLERYEQKQQQLLKDNEQLRKDNEKLTSQMDELQQANKKRESWGHKLMKVLLAVCGLIALYFLITRLMRVWLRSR